MTKLIIRRLIVSLFILLAVSVLVFAATLLLPGDPARAILGQQATEARVAALQSQMNLDQPAIVRFFLWLGGLFVGDLGTSTATGGPVTALLGDRLGASLVLMVLAAIISIPLGVGFGIWSALHRGKRRDKAVTWVSLTLAALPEFVIGIVLVTIFATSVFQILPHDDVAAGHTRVGDPVPAGPSHHHSGPGRRALYRPDDARDDDRRAGLRLRGDGPTQGRTGTTGRHAPRSAPRCRPCRTGDRDSAGLVGRRCCGRRVPVPLPGHRPGAHRRGDLPRRAGGAGGVHDRRRHLRHRATCWRTWWGSCPIRS